MSQTRARSGEYDALVVGAGHNALTSAAYLARAGLKVAVFERRSVVGGAVGTQGDLIPGYQVDVGSGVHIMIHLTPVVRELELERHGLAYLDMDPIAWQPLAGGGGFGLYRDLERTVASIAAVSPEDAIAYRELVRAWTPFATRLFQAFQRPATGPNLLASFAGREAPDLGVVQAVLGSYGHLIRSRFRHPAVRSALAWLAAQSGPPPGETGAGGFLMWHVVLHAHGAKRAVGGSGMLSVALARAVEHHGGEVLTGSPVERIELQGGRARGVVLADGRVYRGRCVVSGAHVQTTLLDLVGAANLPGSLAVRTREIRVGNGFGMIHRLATSALPQYPGCPPEATNGMQLLCPSLEHLEAAHLDYAAGRPSREPCALAMTFTKLDASLAPPGKHLVYLWGQYYPFDRADGRSWDDAEAEEAAKLEEVLHNWAPNTRGTIEGSFTQSPLDLERRLGLRRGNVMHVEMSLDQLFFLRPLPELAGYRTPIPGLYLTGASTHPGGGVFGASGRAAALVALHDLSGGYAGKLRASVRRALGQA